MCAYAYVVCRCGRMNVHRCMFKGCMCVRVRVCHIHGVLVEAKRQLVGISSVLQRGFHRWN